MLRIAVLGSTGSIGRQTLDIAARYPEYIAVTGLAAHSDLDALRSQIARFGPRYACLASCEAQAGEGVRTGPESVVELAAAPDIDLVVMAIVGAAGLAPTLAALRAGKRVALANKETLVMAGAVLREQLSRSGDLVPIDSEHSAIWQCLMGEEHDSIERVVLTASGGAFRDLPISELPGISPHQALQHPTWVMGPKVTVDSATLMNKGLEVIEATLLFNLAMDNVEVLMHRQSIIHSLVYFRDSSVKAQLGLPDMRLPIQFALGLPHRWLNDLPRLRLDEVGSLDFGPVDLDRYPCLRLALQAGQSGDTYPAALCAADEVAVAAFLRGALRFDEISVMVEWVLSRHTAQEPVLESVLEADRSARADAEAWLVKHFR